MKSQKRTMLESEALNKTLVAVASDVTAHILKFYTLITLRLYALETIRSVLQYGVLRIILSKH